MALTAPAAGRSSRQRAEPPRPSGCGTPGPGQNSGPLDTPNAVRYSEQVAGTTRDTHRTLKMEHTAQALLAVALLRSLPNWDRISEVYGDIDGDLLDLVHDLENHKWEGLLRD